MLVLDRISVSIVWCWTESVSQAPGNWHVSGVHAHAGPHICRYSYTVLCRHEWYERRVLLTQGQGSGPSGMEQGGISATMGTSQQEADVTCPFVFVRVWVLTVLVLDGSLTSVPLLGLHQQEADVSYTQVFVRVWVLTVLVLDGSLTFLAPLGLHQQQADVSTRSVFVRVWVHAVNSGV